MIAMALGFVFGALCLQQQATLPALQAAWILVLGLVICIQFNIVANKLSLNPCAKRVIQQTMFFAFAGLLGFFWAATCANIRLNDALPAEWQQKNIDIVGVITSLPEVTERGERFRFDVEKVLTPNPNITAKTPLKIPKRISLNFYRDIQSQRPENGPSKNNFFHSGERWQFTVRLKRPHSTYNPHGFDFEAWALAENIRATGTIRSKSGYKKLSEFVYKPRYLIEHWREKTGHYISKTLHNKPYAGAIRALVIGDDSQISQTDWNAYLRTGINHLMSISGLHITMLAGLAFAITAFIWRRVPALVMCLPTRKAATIAGMLAAMLYASLAGWSVPTQRTIYMLTIFAIALLIGRRVAISRVLALALVVVVALDPWAVNAPGFWLSFGAVAIIAYVTVARLSLAHWLAEAVNTQWAMTLGLLPLLILMFGQVSLVSPVANAFAIPMISLLVVPLALLGSLLHLDFVLHSAHFVLYISMLGLNWLATYPTLQQAAPPIWVVLVALLGVLWIFLPKGFPQRWLGLVLLLPLFFVDVAKPAAGEMQVTVLDVGQGLAVIIQTANHSLLYDAGSRYSLQRDAGSQIIVPFLRGQGIKKLDGFLVSHHDDDHSGGATSVLTQVPVGWLASSFELAKDATDKSKHIKCFAGQHWQWDQIKFEVLYPQIQSYSNANIKDNNMSCVLKVTSQHGSILLTGDVEKEAEDKLLEQHIHNTALQANIYAGSGDANFSHVLDALKSDVLIAPHHGSKTSSSSAFVQAVGAKHVIFTVGYLNRFNHPKPLIEKRFEESGAFTYRSDEEGAIKLDFSAGQQIKIITWRRSQPRYWQDQYPAKF